MYSSKAALVFEGAVSSRSLPRLAVNVLLRRVDYLLIQTDLAEEIVPKHQSACALHCDGKIELVFHFEIYLSRSEISRAGRDAMTIHDHDTQTRPFA